MLTMNSNLRMTPFDFLKLVHDKKIKWESLTEDEQKTYNKFIINRALGFNNNMLDIVNRIQHYDVTPKESFKYYQSMTGNKFKFNKWIKGSKPKTFKPELLALVSGYLECSCKQAEEYLNVLEKKETKKLLNHIGLQDSEIKKLMKK
jgi:hypothetical protein